MRVLARQGPHSSWVPIVRRTSASFRNSHICISKGLVSDQAQLLRFLVCPCPCQCCHRTRVRALAGKNPYFFEYLAASAAKYCLKPGGEKAGIGLRRESVRFPDIQKVESLISVILCLNRPILTVSWLWTHHFHPLKPISRPCSTEKYPSSRMANRYTHIFDAG